MNEENTNRRKELESYRWFIGVLANGEYRFITPDSLKSAEIYIGEHGGGVYTHAGYLVFASSKRWFDWLMDKADKTNGKGGPQIDVKNIECVFSPSAIEWLEQNDSLLKEIGGKYYENIPRH